MKSYLARLDSLFFLIAVLLVAPSNVLSADSDMLSWRELPSLPDALGVAGPFAGVHNDALIVAGGKLS